MDRTYHCATCNGTNISQQVHKMIPLNEYWDNKWDFSKDQTFEWDDFYYCDDCQDGVHMYYTVKIEEPNDGN